MRQMTDTGRQDNSDEAVANAIRDMITDNRFDEQERITESDLSRKLGASRTPVRMALKLLHAEGLLTKLDGRGYRARQFSEEALLQATEVRGVLEGLAAQRLARTGLSSLNRERLDRSVEATAAIITRGIVDKEAIEAFAVANLIFHRTIMQGSDNPFIEDCLRRLKVMPDSGVGEVLGGDRVTWSLNRIIVSHSQHLIIKKAIEAGDGARAFNMMREHSSAPAEYHELF
ncbi:MAG: GntR family transcriptional regulator [Candidatus Puniceispirillum sp. TMED245]|nr:MAG: GntR family transcriptional regulator [Candidatus Puniceispirillum sp. TMED245]